MDVEDDMLLLWENDAPVLDFDVQSSSLQSFNQNSKLNTQFLSEEETFFKQIDEDLDYAFALSLQTQYEGEFKENDRAKSKKSAANISKVSKPLSIVDKQWELIDPHPDVHALFIEYDNKFFYGKLKSVEVRWSPRMTLCAGVCCYEGRGGLCSVRLSMPLLKLRPRKDLIETLLHEMIHAYLFVTHNNKDRGDHGPEFLSHMCRINKEAGTRITVYHSFHDEVEHYRKHWWKCDGPCQKQHPFFGVVKRAMNRAPGPKDNWWAAHQASCGGKFIKIKEPDDYKRKTAKRKFSSASESNCLSSDIRNFFKDDIPISSSSDSSSNLDIKPSQGICDLKSVLSKEENIATLDHTNIPTKKKLVPFQGIGIKLGGSSESSLMLSGTYCMQKEKDLSLGSSEIDVSSSKTVTLPRISNITSSKIRKDELSSSISSNGVKNLVQSPIKKFLTSGIVSSKNPQKSSQSDVHEKTQSDVSKVPCPVCFILVKKEDINSHLDKCLL